MDTLLSVATNMLLDMGQERLKRLIGELYFAYDVKRDWKQKFLKSQSKQKTSNGFSKN